jgi:hypothetical protein
MFKKLGNFGLKAILSIGENEVSLKTNKHP